MTNFDFTDEQPLPQGTVSRSFQRKEIVERVAAGLRKMGKKPDGLLFMSYYTNGGADWVWDEETICGIPVYHTDSFLHRGDNDCPFEPFFKEQKDYTMQIAWFRRGWEENCG